MSEKMIFIERSCGDRNRIKELSSKLNYDDYVELENLFENFVTYVENVWVKKN